MDVVVDWEEKAMVLKLKVEVEEGDGEIGEGDDGVGLIGGEVGWPEKRGHRGCCQS